MNIIAVGIEFIDMFAKMKSIMYFVYVKFNRVYAVNVHPLAIKKLESIYYHINIRYF